MIEKLIFQLIQCDDEYLTKRLQEYEDAARSEHDPLRSNYFYHVSFLLHHLTHLRRIARELGQNLNLKEITRDDV